MSRIIRAACFVLAVFLLSSLAQNLYAQASPSQPPANVVVTFLVTDDDTPALGSRVTIKPVGAVEGWPKGKSELNLTTGLDGKASVRLGPGKYMAVAHQSLNSKLPADVWFVIKPGQRRPRKIYLKMLYWDCANVTCTL